MMQGLGSCLFLFSSTLLVTLINAQELSVVEIEGSGEGVLEGSGEEPVIQALPPLRNCAPLLDLALLLDASGSMSEIFSQQVEWVIGLIQKLPVAREEVRVTVIQFTGFAYTEFALNTYSNKRDILNHLRNMRYRSGVTRTGGALRKARRELFQTNRGARSGARKVVILFTDGLSIDDPQPIARSMRETEGVTIYTVAVARNPYMPELEGMAGGIENVYYPKDLGRLEESLLRDVDLSRECPKQLPPQLTEDGKKIQDRVDASPVLQPVDEDSLPYSPRSFPPSVPTNKRHRPLNRNIIANQEGTTKVVVSTTITPSPQASTSEETVTPEELSDTTITPDLPAESSTGRGTESTEETSTRSVSDLPPDQSPLADSPDARESTQGFVTTTISSQGFFPANTTATINVTLTTVITQSTPSPVDSNPSPSSETAGEANDPMTREDCAVSFSHDSSPHAESNYLACLDEVPKKETVESESVIVEEETIRIPPLPTEGHDKTEETGGNVGSESSPHPPATSYPQRFRNLTVPPQVSRSDRFELDNLRLPAVREFEEVRQDTVLGQGLGDRVIRLRNQDCDAEFFIILDSSGSVQGSFELQRNFVKDLVGSIKVNSQKHRVGLMQFAGKHVQKMEFPFERYTSKLPLLAAVNRIRHVTGTTYMGMALSKAVEVLRQRRRRKTLVIIVSDGYTQDDAIGPASRLRDIPGVAVYSVALSSPHYGAYLKALTADPKRTYIGLRQAEFFKDFISNGGFCVDSSKR